MKFPDRELKVGNSSALFCFKKRGRARADSVKDNFFLLCNVFRPFSKCWRSQECLKAFWGGCQFRHTDTCNEISPSIW